MRKPFVAGNWKMNKTSEESTLLIADLVTGLHTIKNVDCVICPPFTSLYVASNKLRGTIIGLGAQDLYWQDSGAYTGEISAPMIKEFCKYVIIGHSERRALFHETNETVNKKILSAMSHDLVPIVCVGETLQENEAGQTNDVILNQIQGAMKEISPEYAEKTIFAYEPVWAIGTGKAANPNGAQEVIINFVRGTLCDLYGNQIAEKIRILYGGSVNAQNAADYFAMPDIDGALVGGASLKAPEFIGIVQAAEKL